MSGEIVDVEMYTIPVSEHCRQNNCCKTARRERQPMKKRHKSPFLLIAYLCNSGKPSPRLTSFHVIILL